MNTSVARFCPTHSEQLRGGFHNAGALPLRKREQIRANLWAERIPGPRAQTASTPATNRGRRCARSCEVGFRRGENGYLSNIVTYSDIAQSNNCLSWCPAGDLGIATS